MRGREEDGLSFLKYRNRINFDLYVTADENSFKFFTSKSFQIKYEKLSTKTIEILDSTQQQKSQVKG